MDLIFGRWRSQILYAGVKLGVFEALADEPQSAEAVAETQGLDPENTYRLLRALGSLDLLEERPNGTFALTENGAVLTRDHSHSLRGIALLEEGPVHYALWTHLVEFVRTGEHDAFEKEHGHAQFEDLDRAVDPEYANVFNEAMTSLSRMETAAVREALDEETLSSVSHLCDVAGGRGYLLSHLLKGHPNLTGEVLELPNVVDEAGPVPEGIGVADRLAFTPGDMFEAVPEADGYVMKHILHDWGDERCIRILNNIRAAAPSGAPVFIAEHVVPGPDTSHFAKLFDVHMMVATGGQERTLGEYGTLLEKAEMELVDHHRAEGHPMSVVEGRVS